jgi:hypothetical protein
MEDAFGTCEEEGSEEKDEARRSDRREREEGEEGEKENKTIKKYYLKKMKSGMEIIVGVFLR